MRIIDCEQNTPEWLAARLGIATASEFSTILSKGKGSAEAVGRAKYRRRLSIERITGRAMSNGFENAATRQGHEREPLACAAYMVRGEFVEKVGFVRHDRIECGASPDGLVGDDGGFEAKCPEILAHGDTLFRVGIPPEHMAQVQGNMWICERAWWDFVSFNPDYPEGIQLIVRRVFRDEDYIKGLELAVGMFMDEVRAEEAELRARIPHG